MRNRYTCISHCNKGSLIQLHQGNWGLCVVLTLYCGGWELAGPNPGGSLRKKQIRFAQICTKGWCLVQRKKNGCKGGPEKPQFLFTFPVFLLTFFCSSADRVGVWNCLFESWVSCRCCLSFAGPVQPRLWDKSPPTSLLPWWGIMEGWAVKKSPSVSGRSPPCTGERRQQLEMSITFIF